MADDTITTKIVDGTQLQPADLRLPSNVPFGLAVLGSMRYAAVARVFSQMERASRARAAYHDGQSEVANALVRQVSAFEQLNHVETIRKGTGERIEAAYEQQKRNIVAARDADDIAALERALRKMELEEQIRVRQEQLNKGRSGKSDEPRSGPSRSEEEEILAWFAKVPDFVKHAEAAKDEIVKNAGGEEGISDSIRGIIEMLDSIVQAVLAKKTEQTAL